MALVKKARLASPQGASPAPGTAEAPKDTAAPAAVRRSRTRQRGIPHRQKVAERLAAATGELAAGVTEASAAAEELRRSMELIASGAEEAAGAAQESLSAVSTIVGHLTEARERADLTRQKTTAFQALLIEANAQVTNAITAIQANAERQIGTVSIIEDLDRGAGTISEVTGAVSYVSDQTNLLALNAAIEAARAGEHGRGFAIVADEVRALAETSEASAREVEELAVAIRDEVLGIGEVVRASAASAEGEAAAGARVSQQLERARIDLRTLAEGSQAVLAAALEDETTIREAQRGAEQIASAAEEQAAAASEAQQAVAQQSASLDQSQATASTLAALAEELRGGNALGSSAEAVGSGAEELSATIQELSGAAGEILAAIDQISRGTGIQSAAAQQSSSAMAQVERGAGQARSFAATALEQVVGIGRSIREAGGALEGLAAGVSRTASETRACLGKVGALETSSRRIERIVDSIALVAVQISMLAVSGSIEAARAGERGQGFAVVSTDIRSLARDAARSADRIRDTVRTIQDGAAAVRRALELVVGAAEAEILKNRALLDGLATVEDDLRQLHRANADIAQGSEEILVATQEVLKGAQQVAAAAEQADRAASEAATAARQQARGAEDLAAAVEDIAALADELRDPNA
ncbi:methyl-accepting chemotaxis protein [Methylobacterium planeticum]|uniref:Methyl-accepting chemotaxis protein n=1 Tax=Methylobacterium planeticum TaxID=2615211 RepID=A0A6N6MMU3_9HYPH|nr:methyl-accepting chemotaxis protein [Methylobacterium planeticum]KAB1072582.1 methyl-accepting chemotaxis protein [Methylobacterium planeticum]